MAYDIWIHMEYDITYYIWYIIYNIISYQTWFLLFQQDRALFIKHIGSSVFLGERQRRSQQNLLVQLFKPPSTGHHGLITDRNRSMLEHGGILLGKHRKFLGYHREMDRRYVTNKIWLGFAMVCPKMVIYPPVSGNFSEESDEKAAKGYHISDKAIGPQVHRCTPK